VRPVAATLRSKTFTAAAPTAPGKRSERPARPIGEGAEGQVRKLASGHPPHLHAVACGPDAWNAGGETFVHGDGAGPSKDDAGRPGEVDLRLDTDGHEDEVGGEALRTVCHFDPIVARRDGADRGVRAQVDPVSPEGGGDHGADLRIENVGKRGVCSLQQGDIDAPEGTEGFRQLAPDQAGAHDHHPGDLPLAEGRVNRRKVLRSVERTDARMAGLSRETAGFRAGGQDEVVPLEDLPGMSRSLAGEQTGAGIHRRRPAARKDFDPLDGGEVRRIAESAVARRPKGSGRGDVP